MKTLKRLFAAGLLTIALIAPAVSSAQVWGHPWGRFFDRDDFFGRRFDLDRFFIGPRFFDRDDLFFGGFYPGRLWW